MTRLAETRSAAITRGTSTSEQCAHFGSVSVCHSALGLVYHVTVDAKTINAIAKLVEAFKDFVVEVGITGAIAFAAAVIGMVCVVLLAWVYLRDRRHDQGWERALAAKDMMIEQLNEQNRELRVQALVIGKSWSREEAIALVYYPTQLSVNSGDTETTND